MKKGGPDKEYAGTGTSRLHVLNDKDERKGNKGKKNFFNEHQAHFITRCS